MKLGLTTILILRRDTVIKRKMMELGMIGILVRMCAIGTLVRMCAVAAELGTFPLPRRTCKAERGLELLDMKMGRERAIAWKPGSILMTTVAKVGNLSIVSMMDAGGDIISCLGTEGIWSAKE